jgi:hypothetical protein
MSTLCAILSWGEFLFLPPVCLAIVLVTSATHREDLGSIVRHALRAWGVLVGGILVFMVVVSYFFELVLPG